MKPLNYIFICTVIYLFFFCHTEECFSQKYGLTIGVAYEPPHTLDYADNDAIEFGKVLEQRFGYQIRYLTRKQETTKENLLREFANLKLRNTNESDEVVVFFSGHGVQDPNSPGVGYFLPSDGKKEALLETAIDMSILQNLSKTLRAKKVLFLIDACYSGIIGSYTYMDISGRPYFNLRARQILTAGKSDQRARMYDELRMSVYTFYLIRSLDFVGDNIIADNNDDGIVSVGEIHNYVERKVLNHTSGYQSPKIYNYTQDDGVFSFTYDREKLRKQMARKNHGAITRFSEKSELPDTQKPMTHEERPEPKAPKEEIRQEEVPEKDIKEALRSYTELNYTDLPIIVKGTKGTFEKSFNVSSGGRLILDADYGSTVIESSMDDKVKVQIQQEPNDSDVSILQTGNDIKVVVNTGNQGNYSFSTSSVRFRITVPQNYDLDLKTLAGDISVTDLNGTVKVCTDAGHLEFANIKGVVRGKTLAGGISIRDCTYDVDVRTSAGGIELDGMIGKINANTSAGSIKANISRQLGGDCYLETGAGSVVVYLAHNIAVDLDASCNERFKIESDFTPTNLGYIDDSSIKGKINGGGSKLYLRSSAGRVKILKR